MNILAASFTRVLQDGPDSRAFRNWVRSNLEAEACSPLGTHDLRPPRREDGRTSYEVVQCVSPCHAISTRPLPSAHYQRRPAISPSVSMFPSAVLQPASNSLAARAKTKEVHAHQLSVPFDSAGASVRTLGRTRPTTASWRRCRSGCGSLTRTRKRGSPRHFSGVEWGVSVMDLALSLDVFHLHMCVCVLGGLWRGWMEKAARSSNII